MLNGSELTNELKDAQYELQEVTQKLESLAGQLPEIDQARFKAYLLPALEMAAQNDTQWMGGNNYTVEDMITTAVEMEDEDDYDE